MRGHHKHERQARIVPPAPAVESAAPLEPARLTRFLVDTAVRRAIMDARLAAHAEQFEAVNRMLDGK